MKKSLISSLSEKLTIIIGLLLLIGVPAVRCTGIPISYSDGERTGIVYKISKKGLLWKTWEGELNLGGMATDKNGNATPNRWEFSVADESVAAALTEAARNTERVTLHYKQPLVVGFSNGSTNYIVDGVIRHNK